MPYLVTKKDGKPGTFEVCWTWLPYFLAANNELHALVDRKLKEQFHGLMVPDDEIGRNELFAAMSRAVVDIICAEVRMAGLADALDAIEEIDPERRANLELVKSEDEDAAVDAATVDRDEEVPHGAEPGQP